MIKRSPVKVVSTTEEFIKIIDECYMDMEIEGLNSLYGMLALENKNLKKYYKVNYL